MKCVTSSRGVAIVTGAGQGIGKAIALRLAKDGFAIALVDINAKSLTEVQEHIEALGAQTLPLQADLTKVIEMRNATDRAAEWGPLSVLVNNAGRVLITPFADVTEEEWDTIMSLDLKSVFFMMQLASARMANGGRIVNMSSISGRTGRSDQAHYAAAKAAVISLTQSAALALAPRNITVNAICPGVVETSMTMAIHEARAGALGITPAESLARMVSRIPLGRPEKPEEVAGAVSFLCSADAAYITGQALNVCGGMEMN